MSVAQSRLSNVAAHLSGAAPSAALQKVLAQSPDDIVSLLSLSPPNPGNYVWAIYLDNGKGDRS